MHNSPVCVRVRLRGEVVYHGGDDLRAKEAKQIEPSYGGGRLSIRAGDFYDKGTLSTRDAIITKTSYVLFTLKLKILFDETN